MRIISLEAENFKRLRAVEIRPSGDVVKITGKNEQGKSSVIDGIWAALGGKEASPREPIRKGESEATVTLTLSDGMVVRRRWWYGPAGDLKSDLRVETESGSRPYGPQTVLDRLLGPLTLDPLEFVRMKDKERVDALRALVPGVDFAGTEAANRRDYDERTALGRLKARAEGAAASIALPEGPEPEPVDVSEVAARLAQAHAQNEVTRQRAKRREQTVQDAALLRGDAKTKREQAARLIAEAEDSDRIAGEMEAKLADADPLPDLLDVTEIQEQLMGAEQVNAAVAKFQAKRSHEQEAERLNGEIAKLTSAIEERTEAMREAVYRAGIGVPGLLFGEDKAGNPQVMLDGVPFDQASDAQRLRTSIAVAMAGKPELRIIRCKDGSLLDQKSLAIVAGMAKDQDFQVWMEIVREDAAVGVHIEDGEVDAVEGKPARKPGR